MHHSKININYLAALLLFSFQITGSQTNAMMDKNPKLNFKTKTAVIENIKALVIERYVFPDIAQQVQEYLTKKLKNGAYDRAANAREFANALWADLQESSKDNHFYIEYNPERARLVKAQKSQSKDEVEKADRKMAGKDRLTNFGFKKLEILKGNVGYLDLRFFCNPDYAGATAVAAMNFLASSDAVIIDLRGTPGGKPTMVQLLCSYFIKGNEQGRTHLNTLEQTYDGSIEQYWTISYVPGKRMYDTDVYVLTDKYTGSGAEEFTYNMKYLNRATIVGETTHGSAHNVDFEVIQKDFVMHLPVRKPVNPITGTNWERTGVEPHIVAPGEQALDKAYLLALEKIFKRTNDDDQKFQITWAINGTRANLDPVNLNEESLQKYAGEYGERKIIYEKGELFYQRTGPKYRLIPLKENLFALENLDYFRIEITMNKNGNATELIGLYDDGTKDTSKRTN